MFGLEYNKMHYLSTSIRYKVIEGFNVRTCVCLCAELVPSRFPSESARMLSGDVYAFLQCLRDVVLIDVASYEAVLYQLLECVEFFLNCKGERGGCEMGFTLKGNLVLTQIVAVVFIEEFKVPHSSRQPIYM